jgi:hypothetical protein
VPSLTHELVNEANVQADEVNQTRARGNIHLRAGVIFQHSPQMAIKGEFRGWSKGAVVELDNGQRWRVTEGELYLRKTMVNPKATISPGMVGGWYMQVEGQSPRAKVQRLP